MKIKKKKQTNKQTKKHFNLWTFVFTGVWYLKEKQNLSGMYVTET